MNNLALHYSEAVVHRFSQNSCFKSFVNIHRKIPVPELLFNNAPELKAYILSKKKTPAPVFPANIDKLLRPRLDAKFLPCQI